MSGSRCFLCARATSVVRLAVFHPRDDLDFGLCCDTEYCPHALCEGCGLRHVQKQFPCFQHCGGCATPEDCDVAADVEAQLGAEAFHVNGAIVVLPTKQTQHAALVGPDAFDPHGHALHDMVAIALTRGVRCKMCTKSPSRQRTMLLLLAHAATAPMPFHT